MTIAILITIAIIAFWLFTKNAKKNRPSEEDSYDARVEGNNAMNAYRRQWYSNFYVTDEQYELISNMENIYSLPKIQDFSSYQDPRSSDEQINKFIKWARNKKSKSQNSSLLENIIDDFDIYTSEISVNFDMEVQDDGGFFCEDFNAYGFCITRFKHSCNIDFTSEEWVKVLSEPKLFDWVHYSDWDDENMWTYNYNEGDVTHYLKENNAEFVPPSKNVHDYWDYEMQGNMYELVKVQPEKDISYKGEIFKINDEEFTFLKNEREHLIILLIASYNDDLLELIISKINN